MERQKSDLEQSCEFSVMSERRKKQEQNQKPTPPLRLEAQLKSKSASLPTPLDCGGAENLVKGRDERPEERGALDKPFRASADVCLDKGRCCHTRDDEFIGQMVSE